ncbi:MAG: hypothetical protein OEV38_13060 [Nitrospira sp.]|nr:hypothetical protein [Nitrospira sp.]MDH4357230.1 hypothetical protein [Nitrospira sp.]MDH5320363.1 hypothetical protein [Nitrospira sp.]
MTNTLMVPVHLDALFLAQSEAAAEPTADFRGLPYYDSREGRDVNSDTPWIGDSIVTPPFENSNMTLQAGVHLHWSLPDGLCRGKVAEGEIEMPAVPNRWLIRRRVHGKKAECFIVESDYLWPPTDLAPAVNILYECSGQEGRPFRFLGRKITWDEWRNQNAEHEYLEKLTAIGHGEPTFAAFYPNCMTVFGFHDPDLPKDWRTAQYDLIGWYGGNTSSHELVWDSDDEVPGSMIEPLRRWRVESNDEPKQLLCYASIKLTKDDSPSAGATPGEFKVALGNTVTEALTALLANEVAEEFKNPDLAETIEEQLEALHIEGQLASESQDLGLRLRRYRHQKSFAPVPGSERWTVHASNPEASRLPEDVLVALRELNETQARHGRRQHELEQARRQLYGDWCNYMRCVYRPPDGGRGEFLDIDEVVAYIKTRSLDKVERLKGIVEVTERQLGEAESTLEDKLNELNRAEETKPASDPATREHPTQYMPRRVPGARYWEPTDPVVLITGGNVRVSERHGRDGRHSADGVLLCETLEISGSEPDAEIRKKETRDAILKWVEAHWGKNPPATDGRSNSCIGF